MYVCMKDSIFIYNLIRFHIQLPSFVLYIIAHLDYHCSATYSTVGLSCQKVLLLEPGHLPVQLTKNYWTNVQDAHFVQET